MLVYPNTPEDPAEFGLDVARTGVVDVEPHKSLLSGKAAVRRATEAVGIPYTYAVAGYLAALALPSIGIGQGEDKAVILGDGDTRVPFVDEGDIATNTVLAAGNPRAENKTLHIRPPANTLSRDELLSLWEKKTGKALQREYIPVDAVLKQTQEGQCLVGSIDHAEEAAMPLNMILAIGHAAYVKGEEEAGFEIDPAKGVDASELYPDVKYTTVDEYLNRFL
ncbi:hypothetical protein SETIT_5G070400v2 [Setaria italica]|uniref:NmrA-like domain-containing protein n=1 Tax=Setaria italica TaxID=4555 RepID=A0A368R233_SETIT|nr:hypothetical protein SETIT_5G070400v2 [Setaria italica]